MTDPATIRQILRVIEASGIETVEYNDSMSEREPIDVTLEELGVEEVLMDDFADGLSQEFGILIEQGDVYGWETLMDVLDFLEDRGVSTEESE